MYPVINLFLPSVGLSVDPSTVRSGATWLLERQGSQGEWGEAEMFPDLNQVCIKFFICIILKSSDSRKNFV